MLDFAARGPDRADFLAVLPARLQEVMTEWELVWTGPALNGHTALVVPVRDLTGVEAVLKLGFPDEESEHEGLALQRWGGRGAVRLLRADPRRRALLLERAARHDLGSLDVHRACEVVAGLYQAVHVPAPPQLRPLSWYVEPALAALAALPSNGPLPLRLVAQAVSTGRDLLADPPVPVTMIHTDLHYENVLASARADAETVPWLVIDPKPVAGEPAYEVAPLLWNRWDEVTAGRSVRHAVRRRFHTVVDAAGLDEDRARGWVVVRVLHNALAEIARPAPDGDRVTRMLAIAKAVQD